MTTPWKIIASIALIVACVALYMAFPKALTGAQSFGATGLKLAEQYEPYIRYNGGFYTNLPMVMGLNATPLNRLNFGNCQIQSSANTIAATSTATVDCVLTAGTSPGVALTGITAGDVVTVSQSTTTPTTNEGLEVRGESASSTPGYITVLIFNGTGTTFTWTSTASTSFQYQVFH